MEQEPAIKLQEDGKRYQTRVEIPVLAADFYFPLECRPLLVIVDGQVRLGTGQRVKNEELRSLLRKREYRILELVLQPLLRKQERPVVRGNPGQARQM